jgi:hypothetical protein
MMTIQKDIRELSLACERNENLWLVPVILSQTVQSAGCGGITLEKGITVDQACLKVQSDIDGKNGFPDGTLHQSYENLAIRLKSTTLQLQSGKGTFQPLALHVESFKPILIDRDLHIDLEGSKRSMFNPEGSNKLNLRFHLWNYQRSLFEKEEVF